MCTSIYANADLKQFRYRIKQQKGLKYLLSNFKLSEGEHFFMPIYEYFCQSCGEKSEILQKMNDAAVTDCPLCHKATLQKMLSATAFHLKGTGWYVTDFRNPDKKTDKTTTSATPEATTPPTTTASTTSPSSTETTKPKSKIDSGAN
jgi:putative FmdB family regulatory protein